MMKKMASTFLFSVATLVTFAQTPNKVFMGPTGLEHISKNSPQGISLSLLQKCEITKTKNSSETFSLTPFYYLKQYVDLSPHDHDYNSNFSKYRKIMNGFSFSYQTTKEEPVSSVQNSVIHIDHTVKVSFLKSIASLNKTGSFPEEKYVTNPEIKNCMKVAKTLYSFMNFKARNLDSYYQYTKTQEPKVEIPKTDYDSYPTIKK